MTRLIDLFKRVIPDREMYLPILFGPFRGGLFCSRPRSSLRKVFGLYEHELNAWLHHVLPKVDCVIDVGANDGYFTFGCVAAMRRLGKPPRVTAYEPSAYHVRQLERAKNVAGLSNSTVEIIHAAVGSAAGPSVVMLDQLTPDAGSRALIKIDVEGSELEVIGGSEVWRTSQNFFLIEVHNRTYLDDIRHIFSVAGIRLVQVDQRTLPILGHERRDLENWWLVTDVGLN